MLGSEIWVMLAAAVAGIALAGVVVSVVRGRAGEPEDVTIGFRGPRWPRSTCWYWPSRWSRSGRRTPMPGRPW